MAAPTRKFSTELGDRRDRDLNDELSADIADMDLVTRRARATDAGNTGIHSLSQDDDLPRMSAPAAGDSSNAFKGMSTLSDSYLIPQPPAQHRSIDPFPLREAPLRASQFHENKQYALVERSEPQKNGGPMASIPTQGGSDEWVPGFRPLEFPPWDDPEPYTHNFLPQNMAPDDAGRKLTNVLKSMPNIDFKVKPHQGKWKCTFTDNYMMVVFVVRIWNHKLQLMIESQRRSGDAAPFVRIHREIVRVMMSNSEILGVNSVRPENLIPAPLPMPLAAPIGDLSGPKTPTSVAQEDDMLPFVQTLKYMVESGQPDSMLEGTRALAHLSAEGQVSQCRDVLSEVKVIGALIAMLEQQLPSTWFGQIGIACEFFAISCLANMATEPTAREQIRPAAKLLLQRVKDGEYLDRAMRREAARAISLLSTEEDGIAILESCGRDVLGNFLERDYQSLKDLQMREHVETLKGNLERAGSCA